MTVVTSAPQPPLTIEQLRVFRADEGDGFGDFVSSKLGKARYLPARTSVYPASRFFHRHTVDSPAKLKDQDYLETVLKEQLHVDPETNTVAVLNANDGSAFDSSRNLAAQRELLFSGATIADLAKTQDALLKQCVFPESMEMASTAMLGGLHSYARFADLKSPLLAVEIDALQTNAFIISNERIDFCRSIRHGLDSMLPFIQGELGLRDEESARKLLYSNTFDFAETGPSLLRKLLQELQASIGFYEVQTGQSIGQVYVHLMPETIGWVRDALSKVLSLPVLEMDLSGWLASYGIKGGEGVHLDEINPRWFSTLCLLPDFSVNPAAAATATTNATQAE